MTQDPISDRPVPDTPLAQRMIDAAIYYRQGDDKDRRTADMLNEARARIEQLERERDEALGRLAAYKQDYPQAVNALASAKREALQNDDGDLASESTPARSPTGATPRTDAFISAGGWMIGDLQNFARDLERMWRKADDARKKAEESLLAIQADVRTSKADERLARLQRRAAHLRKRPPFTEGGAHRDKAEASALEWAIARITHLEALAAVGERSQQEKEPNEQNPSLHPAEPGEQQKDGQTHE